jgi:LmbE family N-acetylglucosaminyl deacetylase
MNAQRILVLAPHTDDGEFGCGGAICKWLDEGSDVYYVAFSSAEKSVPKGLPKDILKKEVKEATKTLGIMSDNVILYNYEVRDFPRFRQDILEDIIQLGKELKPDIVLLPSTLDTHQDHQVISQEGFRAFKKVTMLGYEIPWNNLTFNTSAFVFLEERHLKKKLASLECYLSQFGRNYATAEFVKSLAITRGTQIGAKYAETFEVIRWVIK